MTPTQKRMREIEERLKAATPVKQWKDAGDWFHDCEVGCRIAETDELADADCELIAHAPTDMAFLIQALTLALGALEHGRGQTINKNNAMELSWRTSLVHQKALDRIDQLAQGGEG